MIAFRAVGDSSLAFKLDEEEIVEARWFDREEVRRACNVPGAVMRHDVAKAAIDNDPTLSLLVPPKNVVARELIDAWLAEDY